MKRFNDWIALRITNGVATMWVAYLFAVLAIVGYPFGTSDARTIIQWLSQTFIQLTMLSILAVGQKLASDQANAHHDEHMHHIYKINKHLGVKEK